MLKHAGGDTVTFDAPEPDAVAFVAWLRRCVPSGARVLDAGCGRGRHLAVLHEARFDVWACDLAPVAAAAAASASAQAHVSLADLAALPYADATFAAALCVHVLPYHRQPALVRAVGELRRVLRPGGSVYFDLLDRSDAEYGLGVLDEPHTFVDEDGRPTHYSSRAELDGLLEGFAAQRVARLEWRGALGLRVAWAVWATRN